MVKKIGVKPFSMHYLANVRIVVTSPFWLDRAQTRVDQITKNLV